MGNATVVNPGATVVIPPAPIATLVGLELIQDKTTANRIKTLHPLIRQEVIDSILEVQSLGLGIRISQGLRTIKQQNDLYAKGRTVKGNIVTKAPGGYSFHNYGLAIDFCLVHKDGSVSWSQHEDLNKDGITDWKNVVAIFKKKGFEWGGEWQSIKDLPHFQKTFGLTTKQMLALVTKGKVDSNGYIII